MKNNFLLRKSNLRSLTSEARIIQLNQTIISYLKILDFNNKYIHIKNGKQLLPLARIELTTFRT